MAILNFILLYGVTYGVVLFIIAVGLVVSLGLMRVTNLAHGIFAAAGGYLAFTMTNVFAMPFFFAIAASVVIVAAAGVLLEKGFFVHLYKSSELDQVLMTIGLCFIGIAALSMAYGPNVLPVRLPQALAGNTEVLGRAFPVYRLFVLAVGVAIIGLLWFIFDRTAFGARLRAAVDNRGMAEAIGINVDRYFSIAFAAGAGLAAFGGAIGAAMLPIDPLYPFKHLPLFLTIVALSGFGNIKASLVVAVLVGLLDTAGRYFFPQLGAFTVYVLVIGLMLWRPDGLLVARR
jgi:branched-chain amino acid transport system permease protein